MLARCNMDIEYKCPSCGGELGVGIIQKFSASISGRKSRRKITKKQQAFMQIARRINKQRKAKNDERKK